MMMKKSLIAAAVFLAAQVSTGVAFAQAASAPAIAPSKLVLINKLIQIQQPSVEMLARTMVQQTLAPMAQGINQALQQQPADKREALAKSIDADFRKFGEEATALLRERGQKLSGPTWTAQLDERFSEDELKQVIAWLESPVSKKYQQAGGEMGNALAPKMIAEAKPILEPKLRALDASIGKQLGLQPRPANGAASAPAAKPAAKK